MQLPKSFTINTRRCRLRLPSEADLPHVFEATRTPGFNDGMTWDAPRSPADLREPFKRQLDTWASGEAYTFSIVLRSSGQFVGRIAIRKTATPGVWNVGFFTVPRQQGKGYMSEAVAAILALGFETLNADRIEARHATWNEASGKVLARAGMKRVGTTEQGFRKGDKWVAEHLLAIDRAAWATTRQ